MEMTCVLKSTMGTSLVVPHANTVTAPRPYPVVVRIVYWVSVSRKEFLLQPGASQDMTFLIKIPEKAPPGGYYFSVLASIGMAIASPGCYRRTAGRGRWSCCVWPAR